MSILCVCGESGLRAPIFSGIWMWGGVEETQKFHAGKHTSLHFFGKKIEWMNCITVENSGEIHLFPMCLPNSCLLIQVRDWKVHLADLVRWSDVLLTTLTDNQVPKATSQKISIEQWQKPWLVWLYRDYTAQLYRNYDIPL